MTPPFLFGSGGDRPVWSPWWVVLVYQGFLQIEVNNDAPFIGIGYSFVLAVVFAK